jgi:hypothetical protein
MQISKIVTDGSARDNALKRRNASMRERLGLKSGTSREPKADEKPDAPGKAAADTGDR